jgi:glycosyl transferase family 25
MQPIVFILSLGDAVDRRAPLINALTINGVSFEIWDAVDGRNGLPSTYDEMIDRPAASLNMKREMGDAEFACALSHHLIYREIVDRDLDMAVILEDDAIVDRPFFEFMKLVQNLKCDLLLLDHMRARVRRMGKLVVGKNVTAYRCATVPWLTTGYLITRNGAQKLADQSLPIAAHADWPIDITKMSAYAVSPRVVDHPDMEAGASDIRQDRPSVTPLELRRSRRTIARFLRTSYWRKTFHKRLGMWIS